ncbi:alkaline phosphatase family protein [Candidatus Solincola tengchongensis]|uniref:alkaline phosphatase family protein n=1 Tax=Candidatus Solincola tengchongensis TaxID=2900693 RepID=UPI0025808B33|nr:alkaline phosphatase family protein [Candidatus Solincola tengchongensis]
MPSVFPQGENGSRVPRRHIPGGPHGPGDRLRARAARARASGTAALFGRAWSGGTAVWEAGYRRRRHGLSLALALILAACLFLYGPGVGTAKAQATATFDLFSMFPQQVLAPSAGRTFTWMPLDTRNIADVTEWTWLSVSSESPYFTAVVLPCLVRPAGRDGTARSWVLVSCSPQTPEGTVGYIKATGKRGAETHRLWLKVTALSSAPRLELSRGDTLLGQGYRDPVRQPFTGRPLTWSLAATNLGGGDDTYGLSFRCEHPCQVRFLGPSGEEISSVSLPGVTHNYLYPRPVYLKAEVIPGPGLPKNRAVPVTLTLGPGKRSGSVSEVTVEVLNPGMLYCANDLEGPRPHAHQVMPGESTTFMFHVSDLEEKPIDVRLSWNGGATDWRVLLDREAISGLEPGSTAQAVLTATAPSQSTVGERVEFTVRAESDSGRVEEVRVAAEVTDVPNIYYFAIDSMDPEYLDLNRAGTGPGSEGDWLMPNLRSFMKEAVHYPNARVYLPSATDMNHTNALAGTYTGTQGLYMVGGTWRGFTEHDEVITGPNSMALMLYGLEGKPLKRVFEVAKEETGGKALCGFWSNKNWLADIEGERTVDIVGHSERFPLFFPPPYKYSAAGDPRSDGDPSDPLSGPFSACFYSDTTREILIPALLGQFNLLLGLGLYVMPVSTFVGMVPGGHCEDRYLMESFLRSIEEEDPDVCYINIADLDNTGHFTGSSWDTGEWDEKGTPGAADDESRYSPWMRRDECLDILREADLLFADFLRTLKERGVYDNSVIVFLSDHGMENMKDRARGYQVLDLRLILRSHGLVLNEDYREGGGTEINFIWCPDPERLRNIEEILENFTVEDPERGPVKPLVVVNREEMLNGVDLGLWGKIRPRELYSEFWINHPDLPEGHLWPDLFVFPLYNYNVAAHGGILSTSANPVGINLGNVPDNVQLGFPGAHGGPQTTRMPLLLKAPTGYPLYLPGTRVDEEVEIGDIAPTIYRILGWEAPDCVDGEPLPW